MTDVGIWEIQENGTPGRLLPAKIPLEKHLEDWIYANPELLQAGLTIVGRQMHMDAGYLDLLAVDPEGRWAVIELKRAMLHKEVVVQVLDYAACIAKMPREELREKLLTGVPIPDALRDAPREVRVFVVGTGEDPGVGRLVNFLQDHKFDVPISVVSYWVHELVGGQRVLIREVDESEQLAAAPLLAAPTDDDLASQSQSGALNPEIKIHYDAALKHELYPRPFRFSIMFTPPNMKNRCLFTVPKTPQPSNHLRVWVEPAAFAKFYSVDESVVIEQIGEGYTQFADGDAERFAQGLDRLFAIIDQNRAAEAAG